MNRALLHGLLGLFLLFSTLPLIGSQASAFPARLGVSPDNNGDLLISTIREAKRKIYVNIYQFESEAIADELIAKIRVGVTVELLVEGRPLPTVSQAGRWILLRIHEEMKASGNSRNRISVMIRPTDRPRRYVYNHAKYVIVDAYRVLISSENFKDSGHPVNHDPTSPANRGWDIVLQSRKFASQLLKIYREDVSRKPGDVVAYRPDLLPLDPVDPTPDPDQHQDQDLEQKEPDSPESGIIHNRPILATQVDSAELIVSPHSEAGLRTFMRKANSSMDVLKASLPFEWKIGKEVRLSPLAEEIVSAARRGARIRVLLNDENVFKPFPPRPGDQTSNERTVAALNRLALCESLPIEARIIDIPGANISYIHNKGMIVDQVETLISSINGTRNSVENNREVAVAVSGREAARYYGSTFEQDWSASDAKAESVRLSPEERMNCPSPILPVLDAAPVLKFLGL